MAEALTISHALITIKLNKAIILSESLSTLTSITNLYQSNNIFRKNQNQISSPQTQFRDLLFQNINAVTRRRNITFKLYTNMLLTLYFPLSFLLKMLLHL